MSGIVVHGLGARSRRLLPRLRRFSLAPRPKPRRSALRRRIRSEGIVNDVKAEAGKVGEAGKVDADKVVADAKAEAEKIKKVAQSK